MMSLKGLPTGYIGTLSAFVLALAISGGAALGQTELPKAETLIEKAIEATGGKQARAGLTSRIMKGSLEIPAAGVKGDLTVYQTRPNLMYTVVEIPNITRQERGFDGKVAWERDTQRGLRLIEGAEFDKLQYEADFDNDMKWRDRYPKAETIAEEEVGGKTAYKVELTDKNGKKTTHYYDKATNLLVRLNSIYDLQMGEVAVEIYYEDYKKAGELLVAHKQRQLLMGMEQIVTYSSIDDNVRIEHERFTLPEDVKALVIERKKDQPDGGAKPDKP